jgi:hypothetical protein
MNRHLVERRAILEERILPKLAEPIRYSPVLNASLCDLIEIREGTRARDEP